MKFSSFGTHFSQHSGIVQLMDDLGDAMASSNVLMLGGGNPGHIPEVEKIFQDRMQEILNTPGEFAHIVGDYDSPQGDKSFLDDIAGLFKREYGWPITRDNIALTAGSQNGFFLLFNLFAGHFADDTVRKILLPLTPEYIGYSGIGYGDDMFTANKPTIEICDDLFFKYHVDFSSLVFGEEIGAMCVSRPTNPTGNVLSDDEVLHLLSIAEDKNIPLIIDSAYGVPFPNIIFTEVKPIWHECSIQCFSLSKLGLPGARTGIIIASPDIIQAVSNMNATINLAIGSFGPALVQELIQSGEITRMCSDIIKPFYQHKANFAIDLLKQHLAGIDFRIHTAEGAIFLWLWFPGMPISSQSLYERLKQRGVLVIPGHHFFPGLGESWSHQDECIRLTYSMDNDVVKQGIEILADEIKQVYAA